MLQRSVITGQSSKGQKDEGSDATRWATGKAVNRKRDRNGKQERELEMRMGIICNNTSCSNQNMKARGFNYLQ